MANNKKNDTPLNIPTEHDVPVVSMKDIETHTPDTNTTIIQQEKSPKNREIGHKYRRIRIAMLIVFLIVIMFALQRSPAAYETDNPLECVELGTDYLSVIECLGEPDYGMDDLESLGYRDVYYMNIKGGLQIVLDDNKEVYSISWTGGFLGLNIQDGVNKDIYISLCSIYGEPSTSTNTLSEWITDDFTVWMEVFDGILTIGKYVM